MDWKYLLTSFDGRINRAKFWAGVGVLIAVSIVASIIDSILGIQIGQSGLGIFGLLVALASIYLALALYAKRWHDRDKSGVVEPDRARAFHRRRLDSRRARYSRRHQRPKQIWTGPSCLTTLNFSGCSSAFRAASAARPIFLPGFCSPWCRRSCSIASRSPGRQRRRPDVGSGVLGHGRDLDLVERRARRQAAA